MGGLNADLYALWTAGHVYLPNIAAVYARLGDHLNETLTSAERAFLKPGSTESSALSSWRTVQGTVQYVVDQSCINTLDTGEALKSVVNMYAESDLITAEELSALNDDISTYPQSADDPNYNPEEPLVLPPQEPVDRPDHRNTFKDLNPSQSDTPSDAEQMT